MLELSKNNYVFIGEVGIMEFQLDDKILKLLTPVGYPVIFGEKNVYHLYEGRFIEVISRDNLPNKMSDSEIEDTFYKISNPSSISVKKNLNIFHNIILYNIMPTCKLSSAIQCKKYFIHHPLVKNIPYLIYITPKTVSIYTLPKKYDKNIPPYPFESNTTKNKTAWAYTKFIKEYKYKKVFLGSSKGKSNISHHYKTKNNGILLELSKNNYVFIGEIGIIEFRLDDKILKLLTPLGYPVIYGEKNVYHLYKKNTIKIISRKNLPKNMTNSEIEDSFYKNLKDSSIFVKRIIF